MQNILSALIGITLICLFTGSVEAKTSELNNNSLSSYTSSYKNELGSTLVIVKHRHKSGDFGKITGQFKTNVADPNCQFVKGISRPIVGFYTENTFAIAISYPRCKATLTYAGNFDKHNNIVALGIVSRHKQNDVGKSWYSQTIRYDHFLRLSA